MSEQSHNMTDHFIIVEKLLAAFVVQDCITARSRILRLASVGLSSAVIGNLLGLSRNHVSVEISNAKHSGQMK